MEGWLGEGHLKVERDEPSGVEEEELLKRLDSQVKLICNEIKGRWLYWNTKV